jgi:hypothetical protein
MLKGWHVRCFFCLQEKDPSDEHVFPEAIGGTLRTKRVCGNCNSFLGHEVDPLVTDHPVILRKRHEFGMTTRAGKSVDPMGGLFRQGALASDPDKRIQAVVDPATGKITPKLMPHRRQIKNDDGTERIEIALDETDIGALETIVQRHRKREGLEPLPQEDIQALVADAQRSMRTLYQPEVVYSAEMDIFHYQRAICKIAYELACIWIGDGYLDDPVAQSLREFILEGNEVAIPGAIQLNGTTPPLNLWQSEPKAHIAVGLRQNGNVAIGVRVFDCMSGVVFVTSGERAYPDLKDGRFLLMDLIGNASRSSTLDEEIIRISRLSRAADRP